MAWIDETAACLADELPTGSRLIVFGSQARADARPDSDIDVLVIEPEVINRFAEMARLSQVLGQRLIPADVVVMSRAAFEQQKNVINTLAWRADQEGCRLSTPLDPALGLLAWAQTQISTQS